MLSPGAAIASAQLMNQYHRHEGREGGDAMSALLQDFADGADALDCAIFAAILFFALGLTFTLVASVMVFVGPKATIGAWYWVLFASATTMIVSLVYLIEPRVSHWIPSLQSIYKAISSGPSEIQGRVRRWWRWRNKYAQQQRTKLNV